MNTQTIMNKGANAILENLMNQAKRKTDSGQNKPTASQISTIEKICTERNVPMDESRMTTYDLAYAYIGELIATKPKAYSMTPVSDKQREKIIEYCNILKIERPDFNKLEGGWGKSASLKIQELSELVKNLPQPLSEKQYEFVLQIEQCPDAEFIGLSDDYEQAELQMTKQEATDYINKYRNDYYNWIKTRASVDQIARIIQLCDMMDTPIDAVQILQLSLKTASEFIVQLESEYNSKIWQATTLEPEIQRGIEKDEIDTKREELRSFLFGIYDSMGQTIEDELFDTLNIVDMDDTTMDIIKEVLDSAKEFGYKLAGPLDRIKTLFTIEQKQELLNDFNA